MRYQLAIFDLDGTILDTLGDLHASTNYALEHFGYPLHTIDEVRGFVGNGIRRLIERAVPAELTEEQINEVHACFMKHYIDHCSDRTRPYPGIPALLQALRQAGIKTAISSNKADAAVQVLRQQYFPDLFDAATGERNGVPRKPAPNSVENLLSEMHVEKPNAVYIGDSEVDVQTARNAGIDFLIVAWGFRDAAYLRTVGAETIVSTPEELLKKLVSYCGLKNNSV